METASAGTGFIRKSKNFWTIGLLKVFQAAFGHEDSRVFYLDVSVALQSRCPHGSFIAPCPPKNLLRQSSRLFQNLVLDGLTFYLFAEEG